MVQSCSSQASEAAAAHSRSVIARIGLVFRVYCVAAVVLLMLHQQQPYALATGGHSIDTGLLQLVLLFQVWIAAKVCLLQSATFLSSPSILLSRSAIGFAWIVRCCSSSSSQSLSSQSHSALHSLVSHSNSRQAMSCSHFTSLAKCSAQCFPVDSVRVRGGYLGLGGWTEGHTRAPNLTGCFSHPKTEEVLSCSLALPSVHHRRRRRHRSYCFACIQLYSQCLWYPCLLVACIPSGQHIIKYLKNDHYHSP